MHRQAYSRQQFCRAVLATANPMKCPGPAVSRRVPLADPPDLLRRPPPRPVRVHKPVARQLGQVIWSPDLDQVADGDFDGAIADQEVVNDAWAAWRAEVASPNSSPAIRTSASSGETAPVGRFRCANCWFT